MLSLFSPTARLQRTLRVFTRVRDSLLLQIESCQDGINKNNDRTQAAAERKRLAIEKAEATAAKKVAKYTEESALLDKIKADAATILDNLKALLPST